MDIVSLGFIKNLTISSGGDHPSGGQGTGGAVVSFSVELTTPACPVKEVRHHDIISTPMSDAGGQGHFCLDRDVLGYIRQGGNPYVLKIAHLTPPAHTRELTSRADLTMVQTAVAGTRNAQQEC